MAMLEAQGRVGEVEAEAEVQEGVLVLLYKVVVLVQILQIWIQGAETCLSCPTAVPALIPKAKAKF